jgi:radical SAM protein (TIGR01212 family)
MSCPNRDGTIGTGGCIFCSEGGSGDFAAFKTLSVTKQIEEAKKRILPKVFHQEKVGYIAYFQAFTNTYAPVSYLRKIFTEAINHPEVVLLSIATRPDCLGEDVLALLEELNRIKPVWIELGLQTIHERTAAFIRRGYPLSVFEDSLLRLNRLGIPVVVHVILGLPRETKHDMLMTVEYLARLPVKGIKLQLLHILKGTDLGEMYKKGIFTEILSMEAYIDIVISCLEILPEDMVIHRITGDGPRKLLLAPAWSTDKKQLLNSISRKFNERDTWQGKYYKP